MLKDKLIKHIKKNGALGVDAFMSRALFDAQEGYYTTKNVFGRKGDFITSPEISQIFGEMIAVLIASTIAGWREQQSLDKVHLVELGPGRGTLMHDMLRTMQFMPEHARPNQVLMVEASQHLQDQQQHLLAPFMQKQLDFIRWETELESLPEGPCVVVANEFFDALPIQQFVFRSGRWLERRVGVDGDALIWVEVEPEYPPAVPVILAEPAEGQMFEYSRESFTIMQRIAAHVARFGGMVLVVDYGYMQNAYGDSLQALKKHQYTDVLQDIGEVDITAHVNFAGLRDVSASEGLTAHALISQRVFLRSLGAELRLSKLCQQATPNQIVDLIKGLERLISPEQMGDLFKVLIVASPQTPVLHSFP